MGLRCCVACFKKGRGGGRNAQRGEVKRELKGGNWGEDLIYEMAKQHREGLQWVVGGVLVWGGFRERARLLHKQSTLLEKGKSDMTSEGIEHYNRATRLMLGRLEAAEAVFTRLKGGARWGRKHSRETKCTEGFVKGDFFRNWSAKT